MTVAWLRSSLALWRRRRDVRKKLLRRAERDLARARKNDVHPRRHLVDRVEHRERQVKEAERNVDRRLRQLRHRGYMLPKAWFNGRSRKVTRAVKACIARAHYAGLYVTSTTGGQHAPTSWHYSGKAVDVAGSWDAMCSFQWDELARGPGRYNELFGPVNNACVKNGVRVTLGEGTGLEDQHDTHVHAAPRR